MGERVQAFSQAAGPHPAALVSGPDGKLSDQQRSRSALNGEQVCVAIGGGRCPDPARRGRQLAGGEQ